jgi:hypothetical protein
VRWTAATALTAGVAGMTALVLGVASDPPGANAAGVEVAAYARDNHGLLFAGFALSGLAWCALMPAALFGLRERLGGSAAATVGLTAGVVESAIIGASLVPLGAMVIGARDVSPGAAQTLNELFLAGVASSAFPTVVSLGAFAVALREARMTALTWGLAAVTAVAHVGAALSIARGGVLSPSGPFAVAPLLAAVWLVAVGVALLRPARQLAAGVA